MDPVSITVALAGIPGIFTSCVDCFQYIQLGRRFGQDFGYCLAKLQAAELRLTRWGEPIGLLEGKVEIKGSWKEAEIVNAYEWLGQILQAFEEARAISEKYAVDRKKRAKPADLEVLTEETELSDKKPLKKLLSSIRSITKERQKKLSLTRKITWALYGKDNFDVLIEDVTELITDLVELFPDTQPRMEELCKEELKSVPQESIPDLVKVIDKDDEILSKAIATHIKEYDLKFEDIKVDGHGIARLGNDYDYQSGQKAASLAVKGMQIGGDGYVHAGHNFYGPGRTGPTSVGPRDKKSPESSSQANPATDQGTKPNEPKPTN